MATSTRKPKCVLFYHSPIGAARRVITHLRSASPLVQIQSEPIIAPRESEIYHNFLIHNHQPPARIVFQIAFCLLPTSCSQASPTVVLVLFSFSSSESASCQPTLEQSNKSTRGLVHGKENPLCRNGLFVVCPPLQGAFFQTSHT